MTSSVQALTFLVSCAEKVRARMYSLTPYQGCMLHQRASKR